MKRDTDFTSSLIRTANFTYLPFPSPMKIFAVFISLRVILFLPLINSVSQIAVLKYEQLTTEELMDATYARSVLIPHVNSTRMLVTDSWITC